VVSLAYGIYCGSLILVSDVQHAAPKSLVRPHIGQRILSLPSLKLMLACATSMNKQGTLELSDRSQGGLDSFFVREKVLEP
jgi:hypothetical protein